MHLREGCLPSSSSKRQTGVHIAEGQTLQRQAWAVKLSRGLFHTATGPSSHQNACSLP